MKKQSHGEGNEALRIYDHALPCAKANQIGSVADWEKLASGRQQVSTFLRRTKASGEKSKLLTARILLTRLSYSAACFAFAWREKRSSRKAAQAKTGLGQSDQGVQRCVQDRRCNDPLYFGPEGVVTQRPRLNRGQRPGVAMRRWTAAFILAACLWGVAVILYAVMR